MNCGKVVFYDDSALVSRSGLHLAAVPVERHGVIMDNVNPWEAGFVSAFCGSIVALDDGGWRMYYYSNQYSPLRMRIMIAESADGFDWRRRNLGQVRIDGADTNVVRIEGLYDDANCTQPVVLRLPDGRWRMYCWLHGQERGLIRYIISESNDGLAWRTMGIDRPAIFHPADLEVGQAGWTAGLTQADPNARFDDQRTIDFLAAKRLRSNDATYVYYDEAAGQYEMFSVWLLPNREENHRVTPHDNAPRVLRTIHRRVSEDGLNWGDPELVITPDSADPLTQQFYYLSQHRDGDWRIGFLGNYPCWEQTMDVEMCFSRDGRNWLRPLRSGFIPRSPVPADDCMSAYAPNRLIPTSDGRWLMLYRAGNYRHNHTLPDGVAEKHHAIYGASWPQGRFAGLGTAEGTGQEGRMVLKPFILRGEDIVLDAAVKGRVRAELRDPLGGRLDGFELHNSVPSTGDGKLALRWTKDGTPQAAEQYRYDAVQLYLEITDGTVYSVTF